MEREKPLRVGIISANWGVRAHLPAWRCVDGVEVVAICTAHEETAKAAASANNIASPYWDYREMISKGDLDIVDCGTRPSLRYDMTMAALNAGKHVYNGVPFAASLADATDMVRCQTDRGLVGVIDAFIQAQPAVVHMKELIRDGFVGDIYGVNCGFNLGLLNQPPATFGFKWFAERVNGASALRNIGAHALNSLVYLMGDIEEVVGQDVQRKKEWVFGDGSVIQSQVEDTASVLLRFKNGVPGQLNTCWVMADGTGYEVEIFGEKGRLAVRAPVFPATQATKLFGAKVGAFGPAKEQEIPIPDRLKTVPGSAAHADTAPHPIFPMAAIFSDMVQAIRKGGSAAPSFAQGLHIQRTIEAVRRSMETRGWVRLADLN